MKELYEAIKAIAPGLIYLEGERECIPPPVNADTATMEILKHGVYVAGFTKLTAVERADVVALLRNKAKTTDVSGANFDELNPVEKDTLLKAVLLRLGMMDENGVIV